MFHREYPLISRPVCKARVRFVVKETQMNKREMVQALVDAVQKGDFVTAESMLTDDFQFSGPVPEPINKKAWIGMSANLKTAFPDLDYHFKVTGSDGDDVKITSQLSGTHKDSFNLTIMKIGIIPPTNNTFSTQFEKGKITVKDDKIASWEMKPNDGAGLMEILKQLGVAAQGT